MLIFIQSTTIYIQCVPEMKWGIIERCVMNSVKKKSVILQNLRYMKPFDAFLLGFNVLVSLKIYFDGLNDVDNEFDIE